MERLNFGPRCDENGKRWLNEDGSDAEPDDIGFEASVDADGCLAIAIGGPEDPREWELTREQADQLIGFLLRNNGGDIVQIEVADIAEIARRTRPGASGTPR